MLAELARHVGTDLWHYSAPNGGSIGKALLFIAPYADSTVKFPKADIAEQGPGEFLLPLQRGAAQLGDPALSRAVQQLPEKLRARDLDAFNFTPR